MFLGYLARIASTEFNSKRPIDSESMARGIDETGTNSGHALWSIDNQVASIAFDPYTGIGNNSNAGTYGGLRASSTHVFFIADDGIHGHELHQYLLPAIQDQWMVWD